MIRKCTHCKSPSHTRRNCVPYQLMKMDAVTALTDILHSGPASGPTQLASGPASLGSGPASLASGPASLASGPTQLARIASPWDYDLRTLGMRTLPDITYKPYGTDPNEFLHHMRLFCYVQSPFDGFFYRRPSHTWRGIKSASKKIEGRRP